MGQVAEGFSCSNVTASTTGVELRAGKYGMDVSATFGGGSVKLSKLAGDGSTYLDISGLSFSAAGYSVLDLAAGTYRFTIATATAVYAVVQRIRNGF